MVVKEFCGHAHTVTAHLCQGAVCVDVVHEAVGTVRTRTHNNNAVGTDPSMAIAPGAGLLRADVVGPNEAVDNDEIVAKAVHLVELH